MKCPLGGGEVERSFLARRVQEALLETGDGGCFRNQCLVASPFLIQEKALMPGVEWTRTVEAKKLFLSGANQQFALARFSG
jgi:hypothetical protein